MKESAIPKILTFWFEEITPQHWFKKDDAFDKELRERFGDYVADALGGRLDQWAQTEDGCLALILLLDQFTRNIHRGTPLSFAGDDMAVALSLRAVKQGYVTETGGARNHFFLMPLMHSEELTIHDQALPLFKTYTNEMTYDYAVRHRDIIEKFGRYPHRNAILGRPSSAEEIAFLEQPGSSF